VSVRISGELIREVTELFVFRDEAEVGEVSLSREVDKQDVCCSFVDSETELGMPDSPLDGPSKDMEVFI
jgi:hypothetical protein